MTTTTHHPSCPQRPYDNPGAALPPTTAGACLCGPEAAAEDQLILAMRTPDEAVLDVFTHVAQAMTDFQTNAHGRRTPKGLMSCVLLDNELLGDDDVAASLGVKGMTAKLMNTATPSGKVHLARAGFAWTLCGRRATFGPSGPAWPTWSPSQRGLAPIHRPSCYKCSTAARTLA